MKNNSQKNVFHLYGEKSQELREESLVHLFVHLIEDKPVSNTIEIILVLI